MASGDRIYIADKTTLDEVNGKIGVTTDTTQASVMGKANAIIGEVTSTASKIGNSSDTGSTLFGKINNISTNMQGNSHNVWGTETKSITGGSTVTLTFTSNTESAKVYKMGSFKFTNVTNLRHYMNSVHAAIPVVAGNSYIGSSSSGATNVACGIYISTSNVTNTGLTGYNTLASNYIDRWFPSTMAGGSNTTYDGALYAGSLNKSTNYNVNITYYVYITLHHNASGSTTNSYTATVLSPTIYFQLFYLTQNTTTQTGVKSMGSFVYHKGVTALADVTSYNILPSYLSTDTIIMEPCCIIQLFGILFGGDSGYMQNAFIVNNNIYFSNIVTGAYSDYRNNTYVESTTKYIGNMGRYIEYY